MLGLNLNLAPGSPLQLLCLGAHSDDIEIGCGGTILRLIERYPNLNVSWIVFSANRQRAEEAAASAQDFLKAAPEKQVVVKEFRDGFFPYVSGEIKTYFVCCLNDFST